MMPILLLCCLFFSDTGRLELVRHDRPLSDRASLALSSDRASYYVKEPIELTLSLRNLQREPLHGFFMIRPVGPKTILRYRRVGFDNGSAFTYPPPRGHYADPVLAIDPDEALSGTSIVAFDVNRDVFVLDRPGRYEFRATYLDLRANRNSFIDSTLLVIDVEQPPASEREPFEAFSPALARIAQDGARARQITPAISKQAAKFLERFPSSVYARHLHSGLAEALRQKVVRKWATSDEREIYDRLRLEKSGGR